MRFGHVLDNLDSVVVVDFWCTTKSLLGGSSTTKKSPKRTGNILSEALMQSCQNFPAGSTKNKPRSSAQFFETALRLVLINYKITGTAGPTILRFFFSTDQAPIPITDQQITLVCICRIRMRLYVIMTLNDIYMSNNF